MQHCSEYNVQCTVRCSLQREGHEKFLCNIIQNTPYNALYDVVYKENATRNLHATLFRINVQCTVRCSLQREGDDKVIATISPNFIEIPCVLQELFKTNWGAFKTNLFKFQK